MRFQCISARMDTIRLPRSRREAARRAEISSTRPFALVFCMQDDCSALHYAALRGHYNVVKYLLKEGASVNLQNTVGVVFWDSDSSIVQCLLMSKTVFLSRW